MRKARYNGNALAWRRIDFEEEAVINQPSGCILITPESLESMLMKYGHQFSGVFSSLSYVVVDEVHAFMGTERGKQLQSLLHRLDVATNKRRPELGYPQQ